MTTVARLQAWLKAHSLILVAGVATLALVVFIFAATFRLYDERQARLFSVEALAMENKRLARAQCEGLNASNETLRSLLDGTIRNRPPDAAPLTAVQRQLGIDTYRRLPFTDCTTGAKTFFDPPFPPGA